MPYKNGMRLRIMQKKECVVMYELVKSGLPMYMDEATNVMALSGLLKFKGMGRKKTEDMLGLLADEQKLNLQEDFYDVYRGICYPEDEALLAEYDMQYDITVIMPGQVNGECRKTSGHYHGWNPEHTHTFGEVYEVISGTAMFVLQRADNFDDSPKNVKVDDLIFVTVQAGQTLLVPPDYGHCSVNIGDEPLVFSNLAYTKCPVQYESVKYYHGMAYYVMKENGKVSLKFNPNYRDCQVPEPKFATVKENPKLGIIFSSGAYRNFKADPQAFDFLPHPDPYVDEIMTMLKYE